MSIYIHTHTPREISIREKGWCPHIVTAQPPRSACARLYPHGSAPAQPYSKPEQLQSPAGVLPHWQECWKDNSLRALHQTTC